MSDNQFDTSTLDSAVITATGTSAVAAGAPLVPVKMAAASMGGKAAVIGLAAKSGIVMGVAASAAPVVFAGAALYGLWRLSTK